MWTTNWIIVHSSMEQFVQGNNKVITLRDIVIKLQMQWDESG